MGRNGLLRGPFWAVDCNMGVGGIMRSMNTLTRADLAESINRKLGLSRADSLTMVEDILDLMADALASGENVKISGFGTFVLRDKGQRIGRNPKTGDRVEVPAKKVPYFKPSKELRDLVNPEEAAARAS